MPATSLAVQNPDTDQAKPAREPRISKRMRKVLTILADQRCTQREAAKRVGMSETHLSTALRRPEIQAFIARRSRENLSVGVLRASNRVLELVDAGSEHVSLDASKHVLGIAGIRPPSDANSTNVNINIAPGYVIDLSEPGHMRAAGPQIDHQTQTDDNPLITKGIIPHV